MEMSIMKIERLYIKNIGPFNGIFEYYRYSDIPAQRYYSQGTIISPGAGPSTVYQSGTGWEQIGKAWAYKENGAYVVNAWRQIKNKWYYFNNLGFMVTGWQVIGGKQYYFSIDGEMLTGQQSVDGQLRTFGADGALLY